MDTAQADLPRAPKQFYEPLRAVRESFKKHSRVEIEGVRKVLERVGPISLNPGPDMKTMILWNSLTVPRRRFGKSKAAVIRRHILRPSVPLYLEDPVMSSGHFLVEQGVELEVKASMEEVITLLDSEVPSFSCGGCGFRINTIKGVAGSEWRLLVERYDPSRPTRPGAVVGIIEIDGLEEGVISLRIPPRELWEEVEPTAFHEDGKFFVSFISQVVNAFHSHGFIQLPGQLPVSEQAGGS